MKKVSLEKLCFIDLQKCFIIKNIFIEADKKLSIWQ